MLQLKNFILINLIFYINSIPVKNLSLSRNIKIYPIFSKKPTNLVNSSYISIAFMKDIGNQNFFEYEDINQCFINYDYNNFNSCDIKRNDIVEFTFKKEFKNLDYFLSNKKSQQFEYLFSVDLSRLLPLIKDITSMNYMFKGCKNLKYINFGNFDASKVTSMISMFEGCTSLISIKLSHFDTSKVVDMSGIFYNLISLKLLDISNFNMKKVIKYDNMFNNVSNLRYINIYNVKNDKNKIIDKTFKNNDNLIICQNEKIISNPNAIYKCCNFNIDKDRCNILSIKDKISPNQKSKLKYQKTINNKRLIDESIDEKNEIIILGFDYYQINDLNFLINYYFVETNEKDNFNFKYLNLSVYINYDYSISDNSAAQRKELTCFFDNHIKIGNKYKIPCSAKLDNTSFIRIGPTYDFKYEPNNYKVIGISPLTDLISNNPYIVEALDSSKQRIYILEVPLSSKNNIKGNSFYITGIINGNIPDITNNNLVLLVNDENEDNDVIKLDCHLNNVNMNKYTLYCNNEKYPNIDLQNSVSFINDNNDILLINYDKNSKNSLDEPETEEECPSIEFFSGRCTPPEDTKTNSTVSDYIYDILEDIENGKFNEIFNDTIEKNKTYNATENNITYIISTVSSQYNTTFSYVGLEDCESLLKKIYSLDEKETLVLLKLEYKVDNSKIPIIEYQLFLKNGTKMNLTYCDNLPQIISIPVDINETEEFIHNPKSDFYNDQCYVYTSEFNTDLTMYDRKNNYNEKFLGLCEKNCDYNKYYPENKRVECNCATKTKFPELAGEISKDLNLKDLLHQFADVIKHWNLFLFKCYKVVFSSDGLRKNSGSYINLSIIFILICLTIFFRIKGYFMYKERIINIINKKFSNRDPNETSRRFDNIQGKNEKVPNDISIMNNISNTSDNNRNYNFDEINISKKSNVPFNDFEMNDLNYNQAVKKDKRSFFEIYSSIIKTTHPICAIFFLEKDYNSKLLRICLFFFSFILDYSINALFFHDSTMHEIYENRGDYHFIYRLPEKIYSILITFTLTQLINYLFSTEEEIADAKETKDEIIENKINEIFKKSTCKLVLFFLLILLLHLLFWYYLSSFCGVYMNTQGTLFTDTIKSFIIGLFGYTYIICLIAAIIRYCTLRVKRNKYKEENKKNQEEEEKQEKKDERCTCLSCLYKISNLITDIFA